MTKREDLFSMFGPYTPARGDLREYLKSHDGTMADNLFEGPDYFRLMVDQGIITAGSVIRVNKSPLPDSVYFVDDNFNLASHGASDFNMSAVSAEKGTYKPDEILAGQTWSVSGVNLT